jgi:hypothetical protein
MYARSSAVCVTFFPLGRRLWSHSQHVRRSSVKSTLQHTDGVAAIDATLIHDAPDDEPLRWQVRLPDALIDLSTPSPIEVYRHREGIRAFCTTA